MLSRKSEQADWQDTPASCVPGAVIAAPSADRGSCACWWFVASLVPACSSRASECALACVLSCTFVRSHPIIKGTYITMKYSYTLINAVFRRRLHKKDRSIEFFFLTLTYYYYCVFIVINYIFVYVPMYSRQFMELDLVTESDITIFENKLNKLQLYNTFAYCTVPSE